MIERYCCICHPEKQISPDLCLEHKTEGRKIAQARGIRFIDAADWMYWRELDAIEAHCAPPILATISQ